MQIRGKKGGDFKNKHESIRKSLGASNYPSYFFTKL